MKLNGLPTKNINLTENIHCPNCGKRAIIRIYNGVEQKECYKCDYCGQVYQTDSIVDEFYTLKEKEQEKKEMEFFDLREDIEGLRYHIKTIHDEHLITHLQVILNKMTDIIERKEQ
jgi:ribosomal protein L37AE/L43A